MAGDIPKYERQLTLTGRVPTAQPTGAIARVDMLKGLAQDAGQMARGYEEQQMETSFYKAQNDLATNLQRIEDENRANPGTMTKALENYREGFLNQVPDPSVRVRLEIQYDRSAQSALARAKDAQRRVIDDQTRFTALKSFDDLNNEIRLLSDSVFSPDPEVSATAQASMQELMGRASSYVNARGSDGSPIFGAETRFTMLKNAKDSALEGSTLSWFNAFGSPQAKQQALVDFKNGGLNLALPDEEGNPVKINVHDAMSDESRVTFEAAAKRSIAADEAALSDAAQQRQVDLDLQIEKTEDPTELMNLQKQVEQLRPALSPSGYKASQMGIIKKLGAQEKEFQDIAQGSQFVSGARYLNPTDTDSVEKFNKYYNRAVVPKLATMDTDMRNTYLTNLITTTGQIPQRLKGDIESASKSLDVNAVTAAADLVDRVRGTNPNMLGEFNERDLARLEYVRSLSEAGYSPEEAVSRADEALDPKNKGVIDSRKDSLKGMFSKPDYAGKAVKNFQSNWFVRKLPFTDPAVEQDKAMPSSRQLIQLENDYRKAYDSHFVLTGDEGMAEKHADSVVKGLYGATKINGGKQVMKYAPENYYALPNVDNDWMREQMLETAKEAASKSMMAPSFKTDEDVMLVPDPFVTPRTAKMGRPAYKMMYRSKEDGTLRDLLGPNQFFQFDPEKKKQQLIEDARKNAEQDDRLRQLQAEGGL